MSKTNTIIKTFANHIRIRSCGILIQDKAILLIKHINIGELDEFWCPPGGAVQFGETLSQAVIREFKEETSLDISCQSLIATNEHIAPPLHAIEFFHETHIIDGKLKLGFDPELNKQDQIIKELKFFTKKELSLINTKKIHPIVFHKKIASKL